MMTSWGCENKNAFNFRRLTLSCLTPNPTNLMLLRQVVGQNTKTPPANSPRDIPPNGLCKIESLAARFIGNVANHQAQIAIGPYDLN